MNKVNSKTRHLKTDYVLKKAGLWKEIEAVKCFEGDE